jgi:hypothetical protein
MDADRAHDPQEARGVPQHRARAVEEVVRAHQPHRDLVLRAEQRPEPACPGRLVDHRPVGGRDVHVDGCHVVRREAVGLLQRPGRVDGGGDLAGRRPPLEVGLGQPEPGRPRPLHDLADPGEQPGGAASLKRAGARQAGTRRAGDKRAGDKRAGVKQAGVSAGAGRRGERGLEAGGHREAEAEPAAVLAAAPQGPGGGQQCKRDGVRDPLGIEAEHPARRRGRRRPGSDEAGPAALPVEEPGAARGEPEGEHHVVPGRQRAEHLVRARRAGDRQGANQGRDHRGRRRRDRLKLQVVQLGAADAPGQGRRDVCRGRYPRVTSRAGASQQCHMARRVAALRGGRTGEGGRERVEQVHARQFL